MHRAQLSNIHIINIYFKYIYITLRIYYPLTTSPSTTPHHNMATPANLYPGLNDLTDVLEEIPLEVTKYLTLLYEIDAKCIHILPHLLQSIDSIFSTAHSQQHPTSISDINAMLQELIPSLEEKMHVSSIMCEIIDKLDKRLDLAYEVAIRNQEIPNKVRLGQDNHPAMHLHYELVQSLLNPQKNNNHSNNKSNQSTQSAKSESRREAMLANKKTNDNITPAPTSQPSASVDNNPRKKRKTKQSAPVSASSTSTSTAAAAAPPPPPTTSSTTTQSSPEEPAQPRVNEFGEPVYCYCNQVAYGEMVGCDGEHCELEWFHLPCIGLTTLPKGKWYCDSCKPK